MNISDIRMLILLKVSDNDIESFCLVDKLTWNIYNSQEFWNQRYLTRKIMPPKSLTYNIQEHILYIKTMEYVYQLKNVDAHMIIYFEMYFTRNPHTEELLSEETKSFTKIIELMATMTDGFFSIKYTSRGFIYNIYYWDFEELRSSLLSTKYKSITEENITKLIQFSHMAKFPIGLFPRFNVNVTFNVNTRGKIKFVW